MIRRPPRSTPLYSSAASDVYKRQGTNSILCFRMKFGNQLILTYLSLIHISEPTRLRRISYAVFCLKKKKQKKNRRGNSLMCRKKTKKKAERKKLKNTK